MVATMTTNLNIVFGYAHVPPTDLSAEEWSTIVEKARDELPLDFLRGMCTIGQFFNLNDRDSVRYVAKPAVVRAALKAAKLPNDSLFLYCTTILEERISLESAWRRKHTTAKSIVFQAHDILLSKRGAYWLLKTSWEYKESTPENSGPEGNIGGWYEVKNSELSYIGYGAPLGSLCLQKHGTDTQVGPVRLRDLVGGRILMSLHHAARNTAEDLGSRSRLALAATDTLGEYIENLGS